MNPAYPDGQRRRAAHGPSCQLEKGRLRSGGCSTPDSPPRHRPLSNSFSELLTGQAHRVGEALERGRARLVGPGLQTRQCPTAASRRRLPLAAGSARDAPARRAAAEPLPTRAPPPPPAVCPAHRADAPARGEPAPTPQTAQAGDLQQGGRREADSSMFPNGSTDQGRGPRAEGRGPTESPRPRSRSQHLHCTLPILSSRSALSSQRLVRPWVLRRQPSALPSPQVLSPWPLALGPSPLALALAPNSIRALTATIAPPRQAPSVTKSQQVPFRVSFFHRTRCQLLHPGLVFGTQAMIALPCAVFRDFHNNRRAA